MSTVTGPTPAPPVFPASPLTAPDVETTTDSSASASTHDPRPSGPWSELPGAGSTSRKSADFSAPAVGHAPPKGIVHRFLHKIFKTLPSELKPHFEPVMESAQRASSDIRSAKGECCKFLRTAIQQAAPTQLTRIDETIKQWKGMREFTTSAIGLLQKMAKERWKTFEKQVQQHAKAQRPESEPAQDKNSAASPG